MLPYALSTWASTATPTSTSSMWYLIYLLVAVAIGVLLAVLLGWWSIVIIGGILVTSFAVIFWAFREEVSP